MKLLQLLSIYAALAITAFGWVVARWGGINPWGYWLQWLAGALFIYNLDRVKTDPADAINVPRRTEDLSRWPGWNWGLMVLAGLALLAVPLWQGNRELLALTLAGAVVCAGYSLPIFGRRMKSLPLLKTLCVPTLLIGAYFIPAAWSLRELPDWRVLGWGWAALLFNVLLFDLRDLAGDHRVQTVTIAVFLGPPRTLILLGLLLAGMAALSTRWEQWITDAVFALLLLVGTKRRGEGFYEWLVDGALFVPILCEVVGHFAVRG
ncbi:MAG: hypothetical protein QM796_21985 [Chthoniobacteraceae bacterium]